MCKFGDIFKKDGVPSMFAPGSIFPHGGKAFGMRRGRNAFTLIEIVVATAVLAMLVVLVAQIIQSGSQLISGSSKHFGADAQAREVFSRFDLDLKRMPRRADMDVVLSANNNTIYFFCEGPGFYSSTGVSERNTLSLVGYRINGAAQMERLAKGLSWNDPLFLTYSTNRPDASTLVAESTLAGKWSSIIGAAPAYNNGSDPDFHVLAEGVFRIFYCFQLKDGTYALAPTSNAFDWKLQQAASIILTLAVLDGESRKIVGDTGKLITALPTPTTSDLAAGVLPAKLWQDALNNPSKFSADAGAPSLAVSRVRIYQRSFSLNTP